MGSSQNKDPSIDIYLTLSKRLYYAGETVQGAVHINCKANRPYTQIFLRLHGHESVHWQENHGKVQIHYSNDKDTYHEEFLLSNFPMGIKTGQYSLPFSILLPSAFPASFQSQDIHDNGIRYTIGAFFPAYEEKSPTPAFERPLHLRQPPRFVPGGFRLQEAAEAKCWSCCCVCGTADLTFESQTSGLMHNKPFLARGLVDNTRGTTNIKGFKVVLRECIKQVSEMEYVHFQDTNQFVLYSNENAVPVGSSLPFDVEIKVPIEALGYTAIGNIIYRAYFLQLVAEVNCCYSNPRASKHVIFNSSIQPKVDKEELTKAPEGWSPVVSPPVSFLNLKPYMYQPSHLIDVSNQNGMVQPMSSMNQASIQRLS